MLIANKRGVALIIGFLVIIVLLVLGSVFILRSVGEKRAADVEKNSVQAFYLAEAGSNAGIEQLDILINIDLNDAVNMANPNRFIHDVQNYMTHNNPDPAFPDPDPYGINLLLGSSLNGYGNFTLDNNGTLTTTDDKAIYTFNASSLGAGTYEYVVEVTEKNDPSFYGLDMWDFEFDYKITAMGRVISLNRKVIIEGDFTVQVRRDNFARFALFTDHQSFKTGSDIPWFTANTSFTGPIHTNDQFSFQGVPAGTFTGDVTQHLQNAKFYNNGSVINVPQDSNPPNDIPSFGGIYDRYADNIPLAPAVGQVEFKSYAIGPNPTFNPNTSGIYVPNDGNECIGGIYIKGEATIDMQLSSGNPRYYLETADGWKKTINIDYAANGGVGSTQVITTGKPSGFTGVETVDYVGIPEGSYDLGTIVYVDGAITSLKGTVQNQTQITVSAQNNIVITDNILYEQYNAGPPPDASGTENLLGMLSWGGDIEVSSAAPPNINIHGVVMAHNGVFEVQNYGAGAPKGTLTLLGSVISWFYGAVGTSDPFGTLLTGYARNFVYDGRMGWGGMIPPYFPSMKAFIAFTDDIIDRITWQEGSS